MKPKMIAKVGIDLVMTLLLLLLMQGSSQEIRHMNGWAPECLSSGSSTTS